MMRQLVVGIAMLGTEHAGDSRVASRGAVLLGFDSVSQAAGNVPAFGRFDRIGRAGGDAAFGSAGRARIEAACFTRFIDNLIDQERRAKRDPWTETRMNDDAEEAWPGDS